MNWFGKKKKEAPAPSTTASRKPTGSTNPQSTIVSLRETINQQDKREAHIQSKVDALVQEAKTKMASGDKKGALYAMKRKKMYEGEIEKIVNTKTTLEKQVVNLESATGNKEAFLAMKQGTGAMKAIRLEMNIEKVDDMMDAIREEMEIANEISNAIAQPVDLVPVDEDELLAELQELEAQDTEANLLQQPIMRMEMDFPAVPNTRLPAKKQTAKDKEEEEEAELKKLQALIS